MLHYYTSHYILVSGSEKLQVLQEQWLQCDGAWKKSTFYLEIKKSKAERKRGCRMWMTRAQLVAKYNSESLADEIIANKEADPNGNQVKDHPDAPGNKDPVSVTIDYRMHSSTPTQDPDY